MNKKVLILLLTLACALVVVGSTIAIYNYMSNQTESSTEDDGWTDNY